MAVVQSLHFGGVLQRFVILIPDPVIFDSGFGIRTNSLYRFCSKARMSATAGSYRFSMQWRLPTWGFGVFMVYRINTQVSIYKSKASVNSA
jgi:hypothetical protein